MAWARLDDGFHDHPKVGALSLAAVGLWTLCFTWANRHLGADGLHPGYLPAHLPKKFGGTGRHVAELVRAGMWDEHESGWLIHDFTDYLPAAKAPATASEVAGARSEAGRKGAAKRWQADGNLPSDLDGKPMPPSRPVPIKGGGLPAKVRPDPWCDAHPSGTEQPCGACGRARRAHDAWQPPTPTPPTVAELRASGVIR